MYYTKMERLGIVLEIVNKLKNFRCTNNAIIDLYNENMCSFITKFKEICNNYVKQDEAALVDYKGTLHFEEINKKIDYCLPCRANKTPLFVIRGES